MIARTTTDHGPRTTDHEKLVGYRFFIPIAPLTAMSVVSRQLSMVNVR